jgi:hypothetical protein
MRPRLVLFPIFLLALFFGCGDQKFTVTPLRGTVLCKGRPVSEGLVQFSPVSTGGPLSGKAGAGEIGPDGRFVVTTYSAGDGAVIGKCRITAGPNDPKLAWPSRLKEPIEFEVRPDVSDVVIDIQPDGTGKVTTAD